jgi:hypothetical protein
MRRWEGNVSKRKERLGKHCAATFSFCVMDEDAAWRWSG